MAEEETPMTEEEIIEKMKPEEKNIIEEIIKTKQDITEEDITEEDKKKINTIMARLKVMFEEDDFTEKAKRRFNALVKLYGNYDNIIEVTNKVENDVGKETDDELKALIDNYAFDKYIEMEETDHEGGRRRRVRHKSKKKSNRRRRRKSAKKSRKSRKGRKGRKGRKSRRTRRRRRR